MCAFYRPRYHVTAPTGRLNDPNGMFIDGDTLHAYYQKDPAFPFAPKRTGWGHVSMNMRTRTQWIHHPDALYPDAAYDSNGCYSGGAIRDESGAIRLFYTGNLYRYQEQQRIRFTSQNSVLVHDVAGAHGGIYRRNPGNPLIDGPASGYTEHYRDPMITRDPHGGHTYRMVLGAQRENETGGIVLYHSDDLDTWDFAGELHFDLSNAQPGTSPDIIPGGYMWECPNLVSMRDRHDGQIYEVLIFCPQGLASHTDSCGMTHYASSDQCGYVIGHLRGNRFEVLRGFSELDYGHHFYAPQVCYEQPEQDIADSLIMLGWMGLPAHDDTPSVDAEGWVHSLTLPRRLILDQGVVRQELLIPDLPQGAADGVFHYQTQLNDVAQRIVLADTSGTARVSISYEPGFLRVHYAGDTRCVTCEPGQCEVFVDGATVEITAMSGRRTFSIAAFPTPGETWVEPYKI
ncbi:glycoside hydrolase family 32 protein [Corynebacterium sp. sy017]|uniref:glycoside hydrolase family 32 protein n=1 Tax=unclassified Corynebacterium TaxID=2624378 RepID=UPI0011859358|nr:MULTISPECIES: glycoside hydrolase family 32 protein [unclassified Corynebacterium]MBP3088616.1 glycoside hydrolase family 32 protein [Corynebacterium sp. sy017]TSD91908.1 glycoside hydrolase family 32 protein [Corynebacterium sp. SY003]